MNRLLNNLRDRSERNKDHIGFALGLLAATAGVLIIAGLIYVAIVTFKR